MSETFTDRHWKRWAELDPYHGVLGLGFNKASISTDEVRDRFFLQGEEHIACALADAERLGPLQRRTALDFGCGVGRLLRPLSTRFDHVVGVDVAPAMLQLSRENCPDETCVSLVASLDDPAVSSRTFDLVHSFIVLQHIRPKQGVPIIKRLCDLTAPGGALAVHFTVGDLNKTRRRLNRLRYRIPPLHWAYNLRAGQRWDLPISEMNAYPVAEILNYLRDELEEPLLVRSFDQGGHQGMMIVGKRRAA